MPVRTDLLCRFVPLNIALTSLHLVRQSSTSLRRMLWTGLWQWNFFRPSRLGKRWDMMGRFFFHIERTWKEHVERCLPLKYRQVWSSIVKLVVWCCSFLTCEWRTTRLDQILWSPPVFDSQEWYIYIILYIYMRERIMRVFWINHHNSQSRNIVNGASLDRHFSVLVLAKLQAVEKIHTAYNTGKFELQSYANRK